MYNSSFLGTVCPNREKPFKDPYSPLVMSFDAFIPLKLRFKKFIFKENVKSIIFYTHRMQGHVTLGNMPIKLHSKRYKTRKKP